MLQLYNTKYKNIFYWLINILIICEINYYYNINLDIDDILLNAKNKTDDEIIVPKVV